MSLWPDTQNPSSTLYAASNSSRFESRTSSGILEIELKLQKGFAEGAGLSGLRYFKSVWDIKGASDPAREDQTRILYSRACRHLCLHAGVWV